MKVKVFECCLENGKYSIWQELRGKDELASQKSLLCNRWTLQKMDNYWVFHSKVWELREWPGVLSRQALWFYSPLPRPLQNLNLKNKIKIKTQRMGLGKSGTRSVMCLLSHCPAHTMPRLHSMAMLKKQKWGEKNLTLVFRWKLTQEWRDQE